LKICDRSVNKAPTDTVRRGLLSDHRRAVVRHRTSVYKMEITLFNDNGLVKGIMGVAEEERFVMTETIQESVLVARQMYAAS